MKLFLSILIIFFFTIQCAFSQNTIEATVIGKRLQKSNSTISTTLFNREIEILFDEIKKANNFNISIKDSYPVLFYMANGIYYMNRATLMENTNTEERLKYSKIAKASFCEAINKWNVTTQVVFIF